MGSVAGCFDNAIAESFFATLDETRLAIFDVIEGWYSPHRRHSARGYQSPINFERSHHWNA